MAAGPQAIGDIVVPEIFAGYVLTETERKSRIIQSGLATVDPTLQTFLAGGGLTGKMPKWRDIDHTAPERVSTDAEHFSLQTTAQVAGTAVVPAIVRDPVPQKPEAYQEVYIRLNRNQSWEAQDILTQLAGSDPLAALAGRIGSYWAYRLQNTLIAVVRGVIADNVANDSGDMVNDITAGSGDAAKFSAEASIDAIATMGDSLDETQIVFVHSVTYARMLKEDLITFIKASDPSNAQIPTYLGRQVIVDDAMPVASGNYDTWFFGAGAISLGLANGRIGFEAQRLPGAGNGGGEEVIYSRQQWVLHPRGFSYTGATTAEGGPPLATLATAAAWDRVALERKMAKVAVLKHKN